MTISPSGGLPYHPEELGATADSDITQKTGLIGVLFLFGCVFTSLIVLVVASPFLLLGVVEIVSATPTNYRVRWIRKEPS